MNQHFLTIKSFQNRSALHKINDFISRWSKFILQLAPANLNRIPFRLDTAVRLFISGYLMISRFLHQLLFFLSGPDNGNLLDYMIYKQDALIAEKFVIWSWYLCFARSENIVIKICQEQKSF